MRILFLTQWFQPEPMMKGLPFAQELARRGHTVEVLTGFPNYPGGKIYPNYRLRLWQKEVIEGIPIKRVALYPSHNQSGLRRIINYLTFAFSCFFLGPWLVHKADIIYVFNLVTLGPTAFLLRFLFGAKVIVDVQDLWPESVINSGMLPNRPAHQLLEATCNQIYRRADWLTVLSPGFKQALAGRGIPTDKIEVIYNWCDENAQKPAPYNPVTAQELGFAGHFNILFAGTMGLVQGLETVLYAAQLCQKDLSTVQFVLVGGGVKRDNLQAQAKEMGLNNVLFLPYQPPESMGAIYALADALLVHLKDDPLFHITIPSKTQAYLYAGKPIIMAVEGDAADLVNKAGAGIVCPSQNSEALVDAISQLVNMPSERLQQLGQAGSRFYGEELSFQTGVTQFERRMQNLNL